MIYAKAEARQLAHALPATEENLAETSPAPEPSAWQGDLDDAQLEFKIRALAIPTALVLARLLLAEPMLH